MRISRAGLTCKTCGAIFLDFDRLTDQLSRVMVDELGYRPEIVAFLKRNCGRVNASREDGKRRAMRELDAGA